MNQPHVAQDGQTAPPVGDRMGETAQRRAGMPILPEWIAHRATKPRSPNPSIQPTINSDESVTE